MTVTPYADAAMTYLSRGWAPIPLPPRRKKPPPAGWTGYAAPYPSGADVTEWATNGKADHNIGLRMPETVLGLDVDCYDGKPGEQTMLEAIQRLGPLPAVPRSTARHDDPTSGIRFYRVPPGRRWADTLSGEGSGVEVIHFGHRYAVAAPSIHPHTGAAYGWYDGSARRGEPPAVDDIPDLPAAWIAELDCGSADDVAEKADVSNAEVRAWLAALPAGPACRYLTRVLDELTGALGSNASRHDTARNAVARIVRAGDQGHTGAAEALGASRTLWLDALDRGSRRQPDPGEWARMVTGAVAMCTAQPTPNADKGCCPDAPRVATVDRDAVDPPARRVRLTPASSITPRPVHWLWDTAEGDALPRDRQGRFPVGSLVLAVGRAGLGKSQFAVWLVALVTTGRLPGALWGKPRAVVYAASEDSWQMTIVPRLIAAGADLDLVFRVDVEANDDPHARLTLPKDTSLLEGQLVSYSAALVVCDPLLSLIDGTINDYRAREVRDALEPLVTIADRTRTTILALAHFTKASGSDPLMLVSGSAAFGQVIRAAVGFARDEESEDPSYVMSTIKNNLGREDLPSLTYRIQPTSVDTPEGETWVSRLEFTGDESPRSVRDLLSRGNGQTDERTERDDAKDFLRQLLGGEAVPARQVQAAAKDAAISWATVRRAADDLGVRKVHPEIKGPWLWTLDTPRCSPEAQDAHVLTGEHLGDSVSTLDGDAELKAAVHALADGDMISGSEEPCEHGIPRTSCAPCWWGGGAR